MQPFDFHCPTRVIFGEGTLNQLGVLASELGFRRSLLVADRGLLGTTHVERASALLADSEIGVLHFHDFEVNPDSSMVEAGRDFAASLNIDSIVALGGGSSLDCAKGINFLLTNGGRMQDYWGFGKASRSMLPMIAIPTTAGTGSEAQSYALISDAETHVKMACGDPKARFQIAILDPCLTFTQPSNVTAAAGFDAISHALETFVTTKRNSISELFSREAWTLLEANYEAVIKNPTDLKARAAMQLGAYCAGVAIENSMLGAAHACANPLTRHYGSTHGEAIALLLPHVARWNQTTVAGRYAHLSSNLIDRLEQLAHASGLPRSLSTLGIPRTDLPMLAEEAALQWTGKFNPRPFDRAGALEIYECAFY